VKKSPSGEANSHWASRGIPHILKESSILLITHKMKFIFTQNL